MMIIGFDPGRDKCGLAVMDNHKEILFRTVVKSSRAIALIQDLIAKYSPSLIVMGDQTTSKQWKTELEDNINLSIVLVDEKNSSVEAKERYWLFNPPQGFGKLIPLGLRVPPEPIDDIVAVILIERYWQKEG